MILRIVRGVIPSADLAARSQRFRDEYGPLARRTAGLARFHVGARPMPDSFDLVVVTCWSSLEAAIAAFDGDLGALRLLDDRPGYAELQSVAHFEVDESQVRRSSAEGATIRVTVGRVAAGLDASIQQLLRERMDGLEPGMLEAYVGRRIADAGVEVAFVSTWDSAQTHRDLGATFWPDISAQYDEFELATFSPIVSGAGTAESA